MNAPKTSDKSSFCRKNHMEGTALSRALILLLAISPISSQFVARADAPSNMVTKTSEIDVSKKSSMNELQAAYDKACSMVDSAPVVQGTTDDNAQRKAVCDEAKAKLKAVKAQALLWKVWAGVAMTCAATCGVNLLSAQAMMKNLEKVDAGDGKDFNLKGAGDSKGYCKNDNSEPIKLPKQTYRPSICLGANTAAAVLDAAKTKEFQTALMGIMTSGFGIMMNKGKFKNIKDQCGFNNATGDDLAKMTYNESTYEYEIKDAVRKDYASCMIFTQAAMQAMMKRKHQKQNSETFVEAIKRASEFNSISGGNDGGNVAGFNFNSNTSTEAMTAQTASNTASTNSGSNSNSNANGCNSASSGMTFACAVAGDKSLPPFVTSPRFKKEVEILTNKSFDDYLKSNSSSAGGVMASGISSMFSNQAAADRLARGLAQVEGNLDLNVGAYAMGGGGSRTSAKSSGGGGDTDIAGLLGNMLGNHTGEDGEAAAPEASNVMDFGKKADREPAASLGTEKDRSISIFDRVHHRYQSCNKTGGLQ